MENFKKFILLFISTLILLNVYLILDEIFAVYYPPNFFTFSEIWPTLEVVVLIPLSLIIAWLGLLAINWRSEVGYKKVVALLIFVTIGLLAFTACVWLVLNLK